MNKISRRNFLKVAGAGAAAMGLAACPVRLSTGLAGVRRRIRHWF